ncbi:DUF2062 domain-containing protein [Hymenobacter sediminicola]|uniref:DUF2062 domain-containing protein n=1 Tax=Hymenobacter sediminicola TaxID=2761579 RepID=A0A7G7WBP0_9BACT|nr:DUF2062 domain-containing protein [Hymenobacter sediminicola]QNH63783.1 DUF2062 domain-containing protein [Hymenobacter sediminicola]
MSLSVPPVSSAPPVPVSWWRRRLVSPLLNMLKQGLSPAQLSLTVALGVIFGTVPILGITTLMATATAVRLRLNVAALLLVSHLMSPVQLVLLIPLLRLGAGLIGNGKGPELTLTQLQYLFAHDWQQALQLLWQAGLGALLIWAAVSVPVGLALNFGLRPVFRRLLARQAQKATTEPEEQNL